MYVAYCHHFQTEYKSLIFIFIVEPYINQLQLVKLVLHTKPKSSRDKSRIYINLIIYILISKFLAAY